MQVWRMEAETGLGPYFCNGLDSYKSPMYRASVTNERLGQTPTPLFDNLLCQSIKEHGLSAYDFDYFAPNFQSKWCFGFASAAQYFSWVPNKITQKRLREEKVHIVVFEVSEENCCVGDAQVMFRRDLAKPLMVLDCDFDPESEQKELALREAVG